MNLFRVPPIRTLIPCRFPREMNPVNLSGIDGMLSVDLFHTLLTIERVAPIC